MIPCYKVKCSLITYSSIDRKRKGIYLSVELYLGLESWGLSLSKLMFPYFILHDSTSTVHEIIAFVMR